MFETWEVIVLNLFCFVMGYVFFKAFKKTGENLAEHSEKEERVFIKEDPMELRNGFGVTKDKNPTFAEQWVNIMNFSGESQTEEEYEETEYYYPEKHLG